MSKIGLILSHLFVREGEEYKFDMVDYVIKHHRNMNQDWCIVLAGHGPSTPPTAIREQVDHLIWNPIFQENEVGTGHPKLCVESLQYLNESGIHSTLKLRALDYIKDEQVLPSLHSLGKKALVSEQTSLSLNKIGDLFIFGDTQFLGL